MDRSHSHNAWDHFEGWDRLHRRDGGPHRHARVPWCQFDCGDVGRLLAMSGADPTSIHRIIDMGGGHGRRLVQTLLMNSAINRPDVHAVCVDLSMAAVCRGVRLWDRTRSLSRRRAFGWSALRCSVSFRQESVADLPEDIVEPGADVLIDNMMLHGLPLDLWPAYRASVHRIKPKLILFKCFTSEFGTPGPLHQTVRGVDKHRLADDDVRRFFGPDYEMDPRTIDSPEIRNPDFHTDGIIAAKRAYMLWRRR